MDARIQKRTALRFWRRKYADKYVQNAACHSVRKPLLVVLEQDTLRKLVERRDDGRRGARARRDGQAGQRVHMRIFCHFDRRPGVYDI